MKIKRNIRWYQEMQEERDKRMLRENLYGNKNNRR